MSIAGDVVYSMLQDDGIWIEVIKIIKGQTDYETNKPAISTQTQIVKAVKAPEKISREFFKQTEVVEKYVTPFILNPSRLLFVLSPGDHILAEGQRYNIKDIQKIDKEVWLINCSVFTGERNE